MYIYTNIYIYIYRSHPGSSFALSSIDIPIFDFNLLTTAMPPKSSPQLAKQDNATDSEKSEPKLSTLAMAVLAAGSVRTLYDSDWSQAKKDSEKRKLKQENKAKKASAKRRKLRAKLGKAELDSEEALITDGPDRSSSEPE